MYEFTLFQRRAGMTAPLAPGPPQISSESTETVYIATPIDL